MEWFTHHWVEIVAAVALVDQLLGIVAAWTPWDVDDRISRVLSNLVKNFFRKSS